jgi:RNA polymerase sigma-70 factor, ECF subfamily
MDPEAEVQLVARCRHGEAEAWDQLFDRHYAAVGRFLFQLGPDFSREDVEEVTQETFLAVIRNLDSFHGTSQLQTWLFRIAANKARDFRERRQAAKRGGSQAPLSLQTEDPESGLTLDPPSATPGPDIALESAEDCALLRLALDELDEPCRRLIEMRYLGDLSYEELAADFNVNPKTISSRLSRCLDRLEQRLAPRLTREKSSSSSV